MTEITCPECGHVLSYENIQRAADEFCPHCDFPLFWAPSNVPAVVASGESEATLRRLPGAGGRRLVGTKICPACGEHNALTAKLCIRCTADLDPKEPEPEPEPEPVMLQIPPPPLPTPKRRRWWLWVLVGVAAVAVPLIVVWLVF